MGSGAIPHSALIHIIRAKSARHLVQGPKFAATGAKKSADLSAQILTVEQCLNTTLIGKKGGLN